MPFLSCHSVLFLFIFIFSNFFLPLLFLPLCFSHVLITHFALHSAQACQKNLLLKFLAFFILSTLLCSALMPFWDGLPACILDHYICLFIEQIFISLLFMTKERLLLDVLWVAKCFHVVFFETCNYSLAQEGNIIQMSLML